MPKYLNTNSTVVYIDGFRIEPNSTLETEVWLSALPNGVSKVADEPYYNPIILSAVYLTSQVVDVPASALNNYKISIHATGEVYVKFNSDNAVAHLIPEGSTLVKFCPKRIIDKLILTIETDRAAYIHIEKS